MTQKQYRHSKNLQNEKTFDMSSPQEREHIWLCKDLLFNAKNGYDNGVKRCLDGGANINYKETERPDLRFRAVNNEDKKVNVRDSSNGWTGLHFAVQIKDATIVHLLIDRGIDINIQTTNGLSALHLAVQIENIEIVQLLIESGINLNLKQKDGLTALHYAAKTLQTEISNVLINRGIDINTQTANGWTALHFAIQRMSTQLIHLLIKRGIDLNLQTKSGWTALHYAALYRDTEMSRLLIDGGIGLNIQNQMGMTALHNAALYGRAEHVSMLFARGIDFNIQDNMGCTALHVAAFNKKIEITHFLVDNGIDYNIQTKDGMHTLHLAALTGDTNIVNLMFEIGIDHNIQSKDGQTALHYAAMSRNKDLVRFLIERGINSKLISKDNTTALHIAASKGDTDIVRLLISCSIDPNIQTECGKTALHFAARNDNLNVVNDLINHGCDQNLQDSFGKTALLYAVERNNMNIARALIDNGCDRILRDKGGQNALHYVAAYGSSSLARRIFDPKIDKNLQDNEGNTALHIAARENKAEIVEYLLSIDCNPHINNIEGNKPIQMDTDEISTILLTEYDESILPGLPLEVKKFDKKSAHVFSSLLEEESYPHFESRVMLVGEQGTGKTTIVRYLVGKPPTTSRISTDGIELFNGLSYMDRETNDWLEGEQAFSLEEIIVSRSLSQESKTTKIINSQDKNPISQDMPPTATDKYFSVNENDKHDKKHVSNELKPSNAMIEEAAIGGISSPKTIKTEFDHFKINSNRQSKTKKIYTSKQTKDVEKQMSDQLFEQTDTTQEIDGAYGPCVQEQYPASLDLQEGISAYDRTNVNNQSKKNEQKVQTVKDNIDSLNDRGDKCETEGDSIQSDFIDEIHIETVTKTGMIRKLKKIFGITKKVKEVKMSITKETLLEKSSAVGMKQLHSKKIAPIIIWDFGGQDVFYSTHQTFLTYRAIYIIVLDGSRRLDDSCPEEQYLPGKTGAKAQKDYLIFWINTIVTYCKGSIQGFPKIMIVLTHKDEINPNEVEQRRNELFTEIKQMFEQTPFIHNLVIKDEIFVNAKDKNDIEMLRIKNVIVREATDQPTWGEHLPKCFIPLELEFAYLVRQNVPLITLEHLRKLNECHPIRPLTEPELVVFLKFQHSIGKILYFDEENLNNHVILSPTHVIDAFKSIVTDRRFCERDKKRMKMLNVMGTKGMVSKNVIQEVWKDKKYRKFYRDKDYLLDVMTHLDILVEPKRYDSDHKRIPVDFYYVASMVRVKDDSGYLESHGFLQRNIGIAFQPSSLMIPPALSFRFISYCLYVWEVKKYGPNKTDMLFHKSVVFTVDPSLDLYIVCEDEMIVARLVHARTNVLIMKDLASSIKECLTYALEKISQLYVRTCSDQSHDVAASFISSLCCSSPDKPCTLKIDEVDKIDDIWICPSHGIEHTKHTMKSWITEKVEGKCEKDCPVTNDEFLKEIPSDLHLRRLSLLYSRNEIRELAIYLGLSHTAVSNVCAQESRVDEPERLSFEILRKCRDKFSLTFQMVRDVAVKWEIQNPHTICKVVEGAHIDVDGKWDMLLTEEHTDKLAPLVGNNSLQFLIEIGMEFKTWEQISHRQTELDLVKLNNDILEEWRTNFCRMHGIKPTLRKVAQAFCNIGKDVKIVESTLYESF